MMDGNKLEELRELVEFLKANGIAEFDMERNDLKVRIKFAGPRLRWDRSGATGRLLASAPAVRPAACPLRAVRLPGGGCGRPEEKLHEVKSPIVGTFYDSPSPGAPAFVKVGDQVEVARCSASSRR